MRHRLLSKLPSPVAQVLALAALLLRRAAKGRRGLVLVYHRIGPVAGSPARELVPDVSMDAFRAQLGWLRRFYHVVPAREILAAAGARRRWQPYPVAVTFDDDWPSHVRWVLPALRAANVRATFFLSGASLDAPFTPWWDWLQAASDAGLPLAALVPGEDIHAMAGAVEAWPPERRRDLGGRLAELGAEPVAVRFTAGDVQAIAHEHDVGFHTLGHDALPAVPRERLLEALTEGRSELEAVVGRALDMLAYPHGVAGEPEARAAREAGYRLAFTTAAASCGPRTDPMLVGRGELAYGTLGHFALRVERALGRAG